MNGFSTNIEESQYMPVCVRGGVRIWVLALLHLLLCLGYCMCSPLVLMTKKKKCPNVDLKPVHHGRFLSTEIRE